IGVRPEAAMRRFIPVENPPNDYPVDSEGVLVELALKENLDLRAAQQEVEASRALANAAGWESLPVVNLVGALAGNGLAGPVQHLNIFGTDTTLIAPGVSFGD